LWGKEKGKKIMKVIIAGGRQFEHYILLKMKMNEVLKNTTGDITIISGGAKGADLLGEKYAKEKGYKIKRIEADWDNINVTGAIIKTNDFGKPYNAFAGIQRNQKMADIADGLVAFWDGKSTGTKSMIDIATKKGIKVRVIKYA
jgi:hypothetical protein